VLGCNHPHTLVHSPVIAEPLNLDMPSLEWPHVADAAAQQYIASDAAAPDAATLGSDTEMVVRDDPASGPTVGAATATARVQDLYKLYRKYGDGLGGNIDGVDGSLSPGALTRAFGLLGVDGHTVAVDLGAGAGRPVLAAALLGAREAVGIELPVNQGQKMIFDAVRSRLAELPGALTGLAERCRLEMADINDLAALPPGASVAFTFWVGMHPATRRHILLLAARCPTLRALAVFKTSDFGTIDTVLDALNVDERDGSLLWECSGTLRTTMMGSGAQHTMWAFTRRGRAVTNRVWPGGDDAGYGSEVARTGGDAPPPFVDSAPGNGVVLMPWCTSDNVACLASSESQGCDHPHTLVELRHVGQVVTFLDEMVHESHHGEAEITYSLQLFFSLSSSADSRMLRTNRKAPVRHGFEKPNGGNAWSSGEIAADLPKQVGRRLVAGWDGEFAAYTPEAAGVQHYQGDELDGANVRIWSSAALKADRLLQDWQDLAEVIGVVTDKFATAHGIAVQLHSLWALKKRPASETAGDGPLFRAHVDAFMPGAGHIGTCCMPVAFTAAATPAAVPQRSFGIESAADADVTALLALADPALLSRPRKRKVRAHLLVLRMLSSLVCLTVRTSRACFLPVPMAKAPACCRPPQPALRCTTRHASPRSNADRLQRWRRRVPVGRNERVQHRFGRPLPFSVERIACRVDLPCARQVSAAHDAAVDLWVKHFPVRRGERISCVVCDMRTSYGCRCCGVGLCTRRREFEFSTGMKIVDSCHALFHSANTRAVTSTSAGCRREWSPPGMCRGTYALALLRLFHAHFPRRSPRPTRGRCALCDEKTPSCCPACVVHLCSKIRTFTVNGATLHMACHSAYHAFGSRIAFDRRALSFRTPQ
jgi:hypothetical protein